MESEINNMFKKFEKTYNRKYRGVAEHKKALKNFKNNYKKVAKLNKGKIKEFEDTGIHSYHLNRYADQDARELLEHYGVTMLPYYLVKNEQDYLHKYEANMKKLPIENMNLYNLDDTERIYENFKKQYNRKNYTQPYEKATHYQRFYKTLVELNNKRFNGDDEAYIDSEADVIKKPHEYFFEKK
ncbi:unnamed protein product [Arctia plantaginis]|uniref:Cathepsin propeptide inhibitor domain-containing protein n=1 Tax=Arctia plantaginis TaxID=874455 RepID=A0A8S0ZFS3_ARCPL|nr:unnamed protein product [Arctia plantaginis]